MDVARSTVIGGAQDIGGLRRQVRARRRAVSVPLLVTGAAITAVSARDLAFRIFETRVQFRPWETVDYGVLGSWPARLVVWVLLPAAFAGLWWSRRRLRTERGVGVTRPSVVAAGVVAATVVITPFFLVMLILGAFLAFSLGLLVIGVAERTTTVWAWALGVGALGVLNSFGFFERLVPQSYYVENLQAMITLSLAVLTVVAGAVAWQHENRVLSAP